MSQEQIRVATNIKINDSFGLELFSADSGPGSGISKYLSGNTAAFIASAELSQYLTKDVSTLPSDPLGIGMTFASDGSFGTTGVDWKFSAGTSVKVHATQAGAKLPGDALFGHSVIADPQSTILDVTFSPTLAVGLTQG